MGKPRTSPDLDSTNTNTAASERPVSSTSKNRSDTHHTHHPHPPHIDGLESLHRPDGCPAQHRHVIDLFTLYNEGRIKPSVRPKNRWWGESRRRTAQLGRPLVSSPRRAAVESRDHLALLVKSKEFGARHAQGTLLDLVFSGKHLLDTYLE